MCQCIFFVFEAVVQDNVSFTKVFFLFLALLTILFSGAKSFKDIIGNSCILKQREHELNQTR